MGPFWEYQARCTSLLRAGEPVVDLCIYLGEDVPAKTFAYKLPVVPEGYNFDVCTRDALMNRFSADGGGLAVAGGMRYRALVVQDRTYLSPEVLARIGELERAGVPVVWCNRGERLAERLPAFGIRPDFAVTSANRPDDRIAFFHRRTADADLYFVYNHSDRPCDTPVTLRTPFGRAEQWDPRTATRFPLPMGADKTVQLRLEPHQSCFVVVE